MVYKGYEGSLEYSEDGKVYYGKVENIKSLVSYECKDKEGLFCAFKESVDDYLSLREGLGWPGEDKVEVV